MKQRKYSFGTKILMGCSVAVLIATGFIGHSTYKQSMNYKNGANKAHTTAIAENRRAKGLTQKKLTQQFKTYEPNLATTERTNKTKVKRAVYLACNKLHSNKDVKKYQKTIKRNLGRDVGQRLINDTKPNLGAQGNVFQQSHKLLGLKVGFGQFNNDSKVLPMNIWIKYQTSPYINGSARARKYGHGTRKTYYDTFNIDILTQSHPQQYSVVDHECSQNDHEA